MVTSSAADRFGRAFRPSDPFERERRSVELPSMMSEITMTASRWLSLNVLRAIGLFVALTVASTTAFAQVVLKAGDILVAEPGTRRSASSSRTGTNRHLPGWTALAAAQDRGRGARAEGDIIVVHRATGLIRVNPATGVQSVLSTGGTFRDPWAIAIDKTRATSTSPTAATTTTGPRSTRPARSFASIRSPAPRSSSPPGARATSSRQAPPARTRRRPARTLAHPYGIAIDYTTNPGDARRGGHGLVQRQGRDHPYPAGPGWRADAAVGTGDRLPAPRWRRSSPLGCPMGVAVEPNGNILTTVFTFPVPSTPTIPPPAGTFYGCAPPGIFRVDLTSNVQTS